MEREAEMAKRRRTPGRKALISRLPIELSRSLFPPGPYHLLVLAEPEYIRDNRVWIAAGSARHVGKLFHETRDWGINLQTIAEGSIGPQELRWIQRTARAAKVDGPWCRISDQIQLVLDAYAYSDTVSDDDDNKAPIEHDERIRRMDEAKQKLLKLAGI
jgi:hypothetical protein